MKRHPARNELMLYVESLMARRPISAKVGGHVTSCRQCMAEMEAIEQSLAFLHQAPSCEPSADFTKQLLLAARNERLAQQGRHRVSPWRLMFRTVAYGSALAALCVVTFTAAIESITQPRTAQTSTAAAMASTTASSISPEALRKAASEVQILVSALSLPSKTPPSLSERERRRAVLALHTDLQAAEAALERNPGCDRANRLVDVNLQRQSQALKALYVERSL